MHTRRKILESLRSQLQTLSGLGGVYIQRLPPNRAVYPAITLYADGETSDILTVHAMPRPQDREVTIKVVVWLANGVDLEKIESDMDAMAAAVEQTVKLTADTVDLYLSATNFDVSTDDVSLSAITLTYNASYETIEYSP